MHAFQIGKITYGPDPEGEIGYADETKATPRRRGQGQGPGSATSTTFGDSWEHELVVEAPHGRPRTARPTQRAIAGEGACPPEDSGGVYGFAETQRKSSPGPDSAERDEMLEWADEDFDPTHFDLAAANATVAAI